MKCAVFLLVLIAAFVVASGQESDDGEQEWEEGGNRDNSMSSWWTKFKESFKNTFGVLKEMWSIVRKEASARSADFGAWWKMSLESFKTKVREWLSTSSDLTAEDKQRLTAYLDKLREER